MFKYPIHCHRRRTIRGAVIAELAVCLPVLVVLIAGIIQYSKILHAMETVEQYAREGARYTAENWSSPGFNDASTSADNTYLNFISRIATSSNIPYGNVTSWVYVPNTSGGLTAVSNSTCTSGCTSITKGTVFTVEVSYDMTQQYLFYGLVPGLPKTWTFTAKTAMVAE
jgi:Flp pilus assembly protein TadG